MSRRGRHFASHFTCHFMQKFGKLREPSAPADVWAMPGRTAESSAAMQAQETKERFGMIELKHCGLLLRAEPGLACASAAVMHHYTPVIVSIVIA